MLNNRISDIKDNCVLLLCTDITCEKTQHKQEIDKICDSLINCCIDCSKLTIPMTKPNSGTMPEWKLTLNMNENNHCSCNGFGKKWVNLIMV